MSIKIIKPGILTTLQGQGRTGHRSLGIGPGGAMDPFAMTVSNYLVGNDDSTAVMEINFPGPEILFQQDAIICMTGADLDAYINDTASLLWRPSYVKKNDVLRFKRPVHGTKTYLAVRGGWKAERWMNSVSTHLKVNAGGYKGRALLKDDIIEFNENNAIDEDLSSFIPGGQLISVYQPGNIIRCTSSIEWDMLSETSQREFEKISFSISNQSDRMGYRLNGTALSLSKPAELVSSAVDSGTIQLLPDGNLIILMADHQTTGGYPRIASVIRADIPKMAQLRPGEAFCFKMIGLKEAEDALISTKGILQHIKDNIDRH
jgi:antagonist of KipI